MAHISFHPESSTVFFHLNEVERFVARALLLHADGTKAAVLSIDVDNSYNYSHLSPGLWFIKLEVNCQTVVKRLIIP